MEKDTALEFIGNIPIIWKEKGNVRLIDLFKQAEKYVLDFIITKEDIKKYLSGHAGVVENWLQYSWDKRSFGYGLDRDEKSGKYIFFNIDKKMHTEEIFLSSMIAEDVCAAFIISECGLKI